MRVERIYCKNVFGIDELDFDPDGVSIIKGRNGAGKTSIIRAIRRLIEGGQHPDMLKKGEEKGEVTLSMDDGSELEVSVTEKGTYYHLRGRHDMSARQLIDALTDEVSVNPLSILQAKPTDRGRIVMESIPMSVDEERVREALAPAPDDAVDLSDIDLGGHALDVLGDNRSGLIGEVYEERRGLHKAKRDREGMIRDLKDAVGDTEDPESLKEKRQEVQGMLSQKREEKEAALDEVDNWEEARIKEIRKQAEERRDEIRDEHGDEIREMENERERLNEKISQAERNQQTRETLQKRREELEKLEARYDSLSDAIDNLRGLKVEFAEDLPQDVSIGPEGEIYDTDDIPFANWNEQRQVQFATMIAEMRMGDLQIIPIDGIEKLVGEKRELLLDWAAQSPAQFILTEAVEQDLTVEHYSPDS